MSGAQSQIVQYLQSRGINPTNANMAAVLPALNTNPDIIPGLREQGLVAMEPIVSQGDPGFVGPPTAPQQRRSVGAPTRGGLPTPPVPPGQVNAVQDVGDDPPIVNPRPGVNLGQQIATNTPPNTPPTEPPDPSKLTTGEGLSVAALAAALGLGGAFGAKRLMNQDATQQSQMPPAGPQQSTAQQAQPQQSKAQSGPTRAGPLTTTTTPFKPITVPNLDDPNAVAEQNAARARVEQVMRSNAAQNARGMPPAGGRGGRGPLPPVISGSMPGFKDPHSFNSTPGQSLRDELSLRHGLRLY